MTTFAYVALEPSGKRKTGFVDAADREAARVAVSGQGQFVIEISERKSAQREASVRGRGKASRADVALFTRRMADLASAGLPLDRVLQVVGEQSENRQIASIADEALEQVRGGLPVSQALAQHPKVFPSVFTETLRSGEASGQFPDVATRLADFLEKEVTRRSQIVSAMIYPAVLMCTAIAVIVLLLTFVVPRLSSIFVGLGNDLPASTKLLLATGDFVSNDWMIVTGAIVAIVVGSRAWLATDEGKMARDRALITVPILGPVVRKATVSRFSRVLGTLVFGGVPILEALHLAGMSAGNRVFIAGADLVENEVREGRSIAEAMRDAAVFPPTLTHMVAIGEETGELPKMLGRVSDSLDFEVDNGVRRLVAFVEPMIVLIMAAFVGFVVISIILPIYQAGNLVK